MGDSGRRSKKRKRSANSSEKSEEPKSKVGGLYHCNYCQRSISAIRIVCAICTDFDLCLECFSVGVQLGEHRNDHAYSIVDKLDFPLLHPEWSAQEELLLLEGIESCGLGNWVDIAEYVDTKDADQCEQHYFSTYIESETSPLPDMATTITAPFKNKNYVKVDKYKKHPSQGTSQPTTNESGFMGKRREFEVEYDNDAEASLADMTWSAETDDAAVKETKIRLLQIYNQRLAERYRMRRVVAEFGLYNLRKLQQDEKKRSKEERTLYNEYAVFMQCWSRVDHMKLLHGLYLEAKIREKMDKLRARRGYLLSLESQGIVEEPVVHSEPAEKTKNSEKRKKKRKKDDDGDVKMSDGPGWLKQEHSNDKAPSSMSSSMSSSSASQKNFRPVPLDIACTPDVELLSKAERKLCQSLRLYPDQYLIIKDALMRETIKTGGHVKKHKVRGLVKVDNTKTSKIVDFLEKCGFLNNNKMSILHQSLMPPSEAAGPSIFAQPTSKKLSSSKGSYSPATPSANTNSFSISPPKSHTPTKSKKKPTSSVPLNMSGAITPTSSSSSSSKPKKQEKQTKSKPRSKSSTTTPSKPRPKVSKSEKRDSLSGSRGDVGPTSGGNVVYVQSQGGLVRRPEHEGMHNGELHTTHPLSPPYFHSVTQQSPLLKVSAPLQPTGNALDDSPNSS